VYCKLLVLFCELEVRVDLSPVEAAMARQALNLDDSVPLVKCMIPGMDGSRLYYIAASPRVTPYTPPGHATRAFPVYDVSQCVPVFMKDSWRVNVPDIWTKGIIYHALKAAGVCNILDCMSSGDILTDQ
jgi:hypothetical protein